MEIPELSMKDIKVLLFEFVAKKGDGWTHHIDSFYSGWLERKLNLPPFFPKNQPGGGVMQLETKRELLKKYRDMSVKAAEELAKEDFIGRDLDQSEGFYKLTEKGQKVWEEKGELGPTVSDLVKHVKSSAPSIDDVTLTFLEEATRACTEKLPIAGLVLLGIASEKAVLELEDSLLHYLNDANLTCKHKTQITSILQRVTAIKDILNKKRNQIIKDYNQNVESNENIYPVFSDLLSYLDTVFQIIRMTRNEHAHPALNMSIDKQRLMTEAETYLLASTDYFCTLFKVKNILDSLKNSQKSQE